MMMRFKFLIYIILIPTILVACKKDKNDDEPVDLGQHFEWANFEPSASYYVVLGGNDQTGDGTENAPWATIAHAVRNVPDDGCEIVVKPGVFRLGTYITRQFGKKVLLRAERPYETILRAPEGKHRVFYFQEAKNIIVAGFEMYGNSGSNDDYLLQIDQSDNVTLENNIMHDSYRNDILKVNNMCTGIAVRGNMFYNQPQGGDEHIDANVVRDMTIEDNVFFNDFAASGRSVLNNTHPFVLVKSSTDNPDRASKHVRIRRNVFLNWQGSTDQPFLLLGEDAKPFYEVEDALIENNLFICNTSNRMSAAFTIKGVKDVTFRANTITGYVNHVSFGYGIRVGFENGNRPNANINLYNNIFSDPSGRMDFFSGGQKSNLSGGTLLNNLYYNNDVAIAEKPENAFTLALDTKKMVGDPMLERDLSKVVTPVWQASAKRFAGGAASIEEARIRLVNAFAKFTSAESKAIDAADASQMPMYDILGNERDAKPDIGAYEAVK